MSKGGSSQAQQPVNPQALAGAQTASNVATAESQAALNNAAVYSPFGVSGWSPGSIDPNTGMPSTYNLNQSLSGPLQALFNQQTGLAGNIAGAAGTAVGQGGTLGSLGMGLAQQGAGYGANIQPTANFANVPTIPTLTPSSFNTNVTTGAGGQALIPVQTTVGGPQAPVQTSVGPSGPIQTSVGPGGPIQSAVNTNFGQQVQQAQNAAYQQQTQYLNPQYTQARQQLTQQLADQGIQPGTEAYDRATGDLDRQQQMAYQSAQSSAVAAGNAQQQALFGESLGAGTFANQAQAQGYGQGVTSGTFANTAQQQQYAQQLANMQATNQAAGQLFGQGVTGTQLANQAQNQMFGQGLQNANLYNQAVLGAAGQNAQAQAGNLGLAQAQFQDPMTAMQTLLGAGTGAYGAGLGSLGAALPAVGAAPTWPLSIPSMGGQANIVQPTNLGAITEAAAKQNTLANTAGYQSLNSMIGGANLGSMALTGQGLLGSGGLLGGLNGMFGSGAAGPANFLIPGTDTAIAGTAMDAGAAAGGGGLGGILGGIGSAIGLLSDRRLKTDIRRIGTAANGLPLYLFRFHGDALERVGVMADEVEAVRPDAVFVGPHGYKMVNYQRALEA
jgi:hypothetical protein